MNDTSWADILPNDGKLCERTKKWRDVFQKYKGMDESLNILIDESLPFVLNEEEEQREPYAESVSISEFEDNAADEDDFNVKDVLNQTKQVIEKRKESWNQSGVGYMMDNFAFDNFSNKVDSWLQNNCDFFSSKFVRDSKRDRFNGATIGQKNIVVEKCFDELSDSSVDTAKYILSNRKRRKSKLTMTIKQFCYSAQNNVGDKQFHLKNIMSREYSERDLLTIDRKKNRPKSVDRSALVEKIEFNKRKDISPTTSYSSTSSSVECVSKPVRKTSRKLQFSRKSLDTSGKSDSFIKRGNDISPQSVCKSKHNLKKRISKLLPSKSADLSANPEPPSKECDSDQLKDLQPKEKQKLKNQKHIDLTLTSDSFSHEVRERNQPKIRKMRKHEHVQGSKTREKHISPRKSTKQQSQPSRAENKSKGCDYSKKRILRSLPLRSADLFSDPELHIKEYDSDQSPKEKEAFRKQKHQTDLTSTSDFLSDEGKERNQLSCRNLRQRKNRKRIKTCETNISREKTTRPQPQSSRKNVYSSDNLESCDNRENKISPQGICKIKHNSNKQASKQFPTRLADLPIDSDMTSTPDSSSGEDEKPSNMCSRKLQNYKHRINTETREKHISPQKGTKQQTQSSQNNVYSSDELNSGRNDTNEISSRSVRKSNSKRRKSSKLPTRSPVLPIDLESSLDGSDSDQSTDLSPIKRQKINRRKHSRILISSNESLSDEDKERIPPSSRKLRKRKHRISSETGEKHLSPRKITREHPGEFIGLPQEDFLAPETLCLSNKSLKSVPEKRQSAESSLSNSFVQDTEEGHERVSKHQAFQNIVGPIRVSDTMQNVNRVQHKQWQQYMSSGNQKVIAEKRMPLSRRRYTESNLKPMNETTTSAFELNLTHTGVINSTALKSQDSMIHCKQSFQNICNNIVEGLNSHQKSLQDSTISSCNSKDISGRNSSSGILLYSPDIKKLPKRLSKSGKVIITENDLEENLGTHLKNKFLGNQREFHYECHPTSKLIFIPPAETHAKEMTSESEEDAFDILARKEGGEIIEIIKLSDAKRKL